MSVDEMRGTMMTEPEQGGDESSLAGALGPQVFSAGSRPAAAADNGHLRH